MSDNNVAQSTAWPNTHAVRVFESVIDISHIIHAELHKGVGSVQDFTRWLN